VEDSSRTIDEFLKRLSAVELNELGFFSTGQLARKQTLHLTTESVSAVEYNQGNHAAQLRERFEFLERASAKGWLREYVRFSSIDWTLAKHCSET
jgi:hypothetical protein